MPSAKLPGEPLLILGMHRSGTSYLAQLLAAHGVHIGENLVGPERGNPRGHFEEKTLVDFHQQLIERRIGTTRRAFDDGMLVQDAFAPSYRDEETDEAMSIATRLARPGYWGWKEPRTCLFLPLWRQVLGAFRAVVVYRHPLEVHYSLLRREHWDLALFPDQAMRAYVVYNRALIDMVKTSGYSAFLFNSNTGFSADASLDQELAAFLGVDSETERPPFYAGEFRSAGISDAAHRLFSLVYPEAARVFDELQSHARIPFVFTERPDDDYIRDVEDRLHPLLEGQASSVRAAFGPYLDHVLLGGENGSDVFALREKLGEEIGGRVQRVEAWNREAAQIYEDNEKLNAELKRIGSHYKEQQAFLDKQTATQAKIWEELVRTGKSWKEQRQIIKNLQKENEALKAKIAELGNASSS